VDGLGNAYVTGETSSDERTFPVKGGPDLTYNSTNFNGDVFVAKVNAAGTGLAYCGYIGGADQEFGRGIAVNRWGEVFVTGTTGSTEATFPVAVGPDLTYNGTGTKGGGDAFVAKVSADGKTLMYCGYVGGAGGDSGAAIALDRWENAYITGITDSPQSSFPVKVGPDLTFNGGAFWTTDAFVARIHASGTKLDYCGYIGGTGDDGWPDGFMGVAVDAAGNAYVAGTTNSPASSFPVRVGPDLTYNGPSMAPNPTWFGDAFVARVNAGGASLGYCGYVGGAATEEATSIAVDAMGRALVTGYTRSTETTFPVVWGPDLTFNGPSYAGDAFVVRVARDGSVLETSGFLGGASDDIGWGIAVGRAESAFVAGHTSSTEATFPVMVGPDITHNSPAVGMMDAFVCRLSFRAELQGRGAPKPGSRVDLALATLNDTGLPYLLGTSLGTGPIPIDTRTLDLSPDALLAVTVMGSWPWIFSGYRGVIDAKGQGQAAIHIPNLPALIGVRLHSAFVTLDPAAPSGVRSISNTFAFSITK